MTEDTRINMVGYNTYGRIIYTKVCFPEDEETTKANPHRVGVDWIVQPHVAAFEPDLHYVKDGQVLERPELEIQVPAELKLGQDVEIPIPAGADVSLDGHALGQSDGTLELRAGYEGEHVLTVALWPYKDKSWSIKVSS